MEVVESSPVYEERTFDETTVFVSENGFVSKRRRRKSLGRRVSFAEAPKMHIFPRDDEYVTPTRATKGATSPHRTGGERRSPRLAAKVLDADKENRILASNPASHRARRRGGSKPLAARGEESPALKPHNWLDARDSSSQAGDDENTGPVDLRHLSFDQMETETDEENMTLDSTAFALKSLQQIRSGKLAVLVQLDKISTDEDGSPDEEDVLRDAQDMTFTMNRPLLPRKPVGESTTGFESMSSDTIMSITMQVPKHKMSQMLVGGDNINVHVEEDSITVSPQKIPPPRKSILHGKWDDNSAVVPNSNYGQNGPAPVPRAQGGRAQIEALFGDLGDDTSTVHPNFQGALKSPLQGIQIPVAEVLLAHLEEKFGGVGDDSRVQVEEDSMSVNPQKIPPRKLILLGGRDDNCAVVLGSHSPQNGPALVPRAEDGRALLMEKFGDLGDDTSRAQRNSQGAEVQGMKIPRTEDLRVASEENIVSGGEAIKLPLKGVDLVGLDEDTNLTRGSEENPDMSVSSPGSVASMGNEDRSITMGIPSLTQLIGVEEDEESSCRGHEDRTITMGIPSLTHLIRKEEEHEEMRVEEDMDFDTKHRARETLNLTEEANLMLTEEEFTGIDSRATIKKVESPGPNFVRHKAMETLNPTEDVDMILTEEEFTGIDSRATMKEEYPGPNFTKHRARETLNPTEEADMMLTEEEFTGMDSRATIKMVESPGPNFAKHRARETLNSTEEAGLMLTEEEFTGMDCRATIKKVESPGPNFAKHRAGEALNPTEAADMMLTEEDFTGIDSRATMKKEESPGSNFAKHRASETLNLTEEADMMLAGCVPRMDGKKSDRGIVSSDTLNPTEVAEIMFTGEKYTGIDNCAFPGPNFDNRAMKRTKFERGGPSVDAKESDSGIISSCKNGYGSACKRWTAEDNHLSPVLESVTAQASRSSDLLAADMKSLHSTPVRPISRSMWMTPPSSVLTAKAKDESSPGIEDDIYDPTAPISERIREDGEESISATKVSVEEEDAPHLTFMSGDTTALITDRIPEDEEERISITKMSVDEFLQRAEVQFSVGLPSPRAVRKDPSLAETHHVRSLSESFHFLCVVKPQLTVMQDACEELDEDNDIKAMAVAKLEQPLTAIFSYFQKVPEGEKQRIRKQLERIQGNYRSLAEKNRLHFQLRVEKDITSNLLAMKNNMMFVEHIQEQRDIFKEKCYQPFLRLQASLSSRDANPECISTSQSKLSTVKHLQTAVNLERIEDLKKRLENLKSSLELKSGKSRPREQAAEETLRGLKQRVGRGKTKMSDLRSQLVEILCSGKNNLQKEDVAHNPYLHVEKMKSEVCLVHKLQDGFKVKSAGRENQDMVVELRYRSLLKRRYVVRKVGTAVKVLRSTWSLEPEKIEEEETTIASPSTGWQVFPKMNALVIFSFALKQGGMSKETAMNSTAWTQFTIFFTSTPSPIILSFSISTSKFQKCGAEPDKKFGRLSTSEAARFTLSSDKPGDIPEPTNLRESMQFTRILVGNLMDLMAEIGNCQPVVNASSGGGILAEPRFRNAPDGQLQLEIKFIDCMSSIKFYLYLDMTCLPMNGYPLGDLPAKVEIVYCAPPVRHRFKAETLEHLLFLVRPGYQRLERTYAAVGSFLASLRRGVST